MKNKALIAVLLAMAALSAGCNTVAGAGKDIERGGEKFRARPRSSARRRSQPHRAQPPAAIGRQGGFFIGRVDA